MVLVSDMSAQVRSNLCYLICLRHFIRSRKVTNRFVIRKDFFVPACATCTELPSNMNTMTLPVFEFRAFSIFSFLLHSKAPSLYLFSPRN